MPEARLLPIHLLVSYSAVLGFHFVWASYLVFSRRADLSLATPFGALRSPAWILGGLLILNSWPLFVLSGPNTGPTKLLGLVAILQQVGHWIFEARLVRKIPLRGIFLVDHSLLIATLAAWLLAL